MSICKCISPNNFHFHGPWYMRMTNDNRVLPRNGIMWTASRGNVDRKLVDVAGEELIALDPMCLSRNNPKYSSDVTLENKQKIICESVRTRSGLLCQNDVDFRCFSALLFLAALGGDLPPKNLPKIAQDFTPHAARNRSLLGNVPVGTNELLIPVETPRGIFSNFAARCRKTKGFRENQGPKTL